MIGGLAALGVVAVLVGLFVAPWLIAFGALLLLVTPFAFLLAAPAPPERKHDPAGEAIYQAVLSIEEAATTALRRGAAIGLQ